MKAMLLSLLLFALLLSFIVLNAARISEIRDTMIDILDEVVPNDLNVSDKITELKKYWEGSKRMVDLSVPRQSITNICELIDSLEAYSAGNEWSDFENAKKQLLSAIEELGRLELFDIENIM